MFDIKLAMEEALKSEIMYAGPIHRFCAREMGDIKTWNFWRAVFAEYLGTFVLCLWSIGSGLHLPNYSAPDVFSTALSTGFIVAVLINSLLTVSGGHINPAVSIGFLVSRRITCLRFLIYVIAQCFACVTAVGIISRLFPHEMLGTLGLILPPEGVTPLQAFSAEFLVTFFLLFGISALTDDKRGDSVAPVPIYVGLIVVANIMFTARLSGGCFNPARSFGPVVMSGVTEHHWVYWLGPMLGGAVGTLLYNHVLSVAAMTGETCHPCGRGKSRGQRALTSTFVEGTSSGQMTVNSSNEKDHMLSTEA